MAFQLLMLDRSLPPPHMPHRDSQVSAYGQNKDSTLVITMDPHVFECMDGHPHLSMIGITLNGALLSPI